MTAVMEGEGCTPQTSDTFNSRCSNEFDQRARQPNPYTDCQRLNVQKSYQENSLSSDPTQVSPQVSRESNFGNTLPVPLGDGVFDSFGDILQRCT